MERVIDELPMLYAIDAQGRLRHVDDVERGLACGCTCPACGQELIARNGGHKLIHHFAHRTSACAWAIEAVVSRLAAEVIRDEGRLRLPRLAYHDAVSDEEVEVSGPLTMAVEGVSERAVSGRGVPDLFVTVRARAATRTFALVVTLTHRLTEDGTARLREAAPGVLVLDLTRDLRRRRAELGKHYDRVEVLRSYQDRALVADAIRECGDILVWAANERAEALAQKSEERRREMEERQAAERAKREAREAAERAEREARQAAERAAEEARLAAERAEEQRVERLRAEDEVRRRVETMRDEDVLDPDYDVETWPEVTRLPNARLTCFGGLQALVAVTASGRRRHSILADLRPYEAREVAWHLRELKGDADEFAIVFVASEAHLAVAIEASEHDDGLIWCKVEPGPVLDAFDSLQAILDAGIPVTVNLAHETGGRLKTVMRDRRVFVLAPRRR